MHISVRELWEAWLRSEVLFNMSNISFNILNSFDILSFLYIYFFLLQVHNWTIEQTSEWLSSNVDLPQYVPTFIQHRVTGATLPR